MSGEQVHAIREAAKSVAERHLLPGAADRDRDGTFPSVELRLLGQQGLLGVLVPERWGGGGGNHLALAAAIEEVAAVDGSCAMILASQNTLADMILLHSGTDKQKEEHLIPFARGESLCAFALTEPESGTDAFEMKSVASKTGDTYVLRGTKQFVTAGQSADFAITFARTSPSKKNSEAFSAFLVSTAAPGYAVGRRESTLGMKSSGTCQVHFENLTVPASALIGKEGDGYRIATEHLSRSRMAIAAQSLGLARAAYELASRYATERRAFGKPLFGHQAVSFRIADMAVKLRAASLLVQDAAAKLDAGVDCASECSIAKLYASEAAEQVAHDAIQTLGGYGYLRDFSVERIYRDARVCSIYEGTSDLMRILIGNLVIDSMRGN